MIDFRSVILERLIALDYIAAEEEPDEIMEELDSVDSESYTTTEEALGNDVLGPESWVVLAQAWMRGVRSSMVDEAVMPPVFVGDPDIPSTHSHWPHATLNEM